MKPTKITSLLLLQLHVRNKMWNVPVLLSILRFHLRGFDGHLKKYERVPLQRFKRALRT